MKKRNENEPKRRKTFGQWFKGVVSHIIISLNPARENSVCIKDPKSGKKLVAIRCIAFGLAVLMAGYYAFLMFVRGKEYSQDVENQQKRIFTQTATRGNIYDCNGKELAVSISTCTISVQKDELEAYAEKKREKDDKDEERDAELKAQAIKDHTKVISDGLEKVLKNCGITSDEVYDKITNSETNYVEIVKDADLEYADEMKAWISNNFSTSYVGISVNSSTKRYYPYGSLASHVLGFVNDDGDGAVCGVEVAMNDELSGTDGKTVAVTQKNGVSITGEEKEVIEEVQDGYNVVLTIDTEIQSIVEEVLEDACNDFGVSEGAAAIVLDAQNCDVLAMASSPSFDLNDPYVISDEIKDMYPLEEGEEESDLLSRVIWRNKALTETYEPGSTFKAITASIAIEEGVVTPETVISDESVYIDSSHSIDCSTAGKKGANHGSEEFKYAVANSCNPVMARVAMMVGKETYYSYVKAFGFRNKTNILLSGEAVGVIHTDPTDVDLQVTAFGQRFTITPIQLATAYCAIANGGTLYEPRLVSKLTDSDGNTVKEYESKEVRSVISENTSETVMSLLEGVVNGGTGERAYVSGYRIAGKTGTSQTTETDTTGRYVVSFCAVAPSDNPEVVVLVMMDHPTYQTNDGDISGARMGATTAGRMTKKILSYLKTERVYSDYDADQIINVYPPTDVVNMTLRDAKWYFKTSTRLYNVIVVGDSTGSETVVRQYPEATEYMAREGTVVLYTTTDENASPGLVKVPDLTGKTMCEAHGILTDLELNQYCVFDGVVVEQSIAPGEYVEKGTIIKLTTTQEQEYAG